LAKRPRSSPAYKHLMIMLGHVHEPLKHLNMLSPGSHLHMNKPLKMTDGPVQTDRGHLHGGEGGVAGWLRPQVTDKGQREVV